MNSQVVTQFQIKENSGSLILTKNMVGVHHVKIANLHSEILYFGYVGWIHVNDLVEEICAIQAEFS